MSSYFLRLAARADVRELIALKYAAIKVTYLHPVHFPLKEFQYFLEQGTESEEELLASCLDSEQHISIVAEDSTGVLIGYFLAQYCPKEHFFFLVDLYVLPSYFRQGVGTKLLQSFFSFRQEFSTATLAVAQHNISAQAFYRFHGFVQYASSAPDDGFSVTPSLTIPLYYMEKDFQEETSYDPVM